MKKIFLEQKLDQLFMMQMKKELKKLLNNNLNLQKEYVMQVLFQLLSQKLIFMQVKKKDAKKF